MNQINMHGLMSMRSLFKFIPVYQCIILIFIIYCAIRHQFSNFLKSCPIYNFLVMFPGINSSYKQDTYQLTSRNRYPLKHPQPSHHQQPENHTKYSSSDKYSGFNDVLRSSDVLVSFGTNSKNGIEKNSSYFLKKMGMTEEQLDRTKKKQYQLPNQSRSSSQMRGMVRSFQEQMSSKTSNKYISNRDKFYDFLYKLTGILSCHIRIKQREILHLISEYSPYSSPFRNFPQENTKIDRLASCYIDIQSATDQELYQQITGIKEFDLSINSQTKSQQKFQSQLNSQNKKQVFKFDQNKEKKYFTGDKSIEYGFDGIVNKGNQKNKDQVVSSIGANSMIKSYDSRVQKNGNKRYDDDEGDYGNFMKVKRSKSIKSSKNRESEMNSNDEMKNSKIPTFRSGQNNIGSNSVVLQNGSKKGQEADMRKESSLSLLIRERSVNISKDLLVGIPYQMPEWLITKINEIPFQCSNIEDHPENLTNCIYHLNPDTFKDSSPDFYQPIAPGLTQLQSKHNTSLQIQLALRNNTQNSEHNQHTSSHPNSNSNNNQISRRTLSQQIYNPNSIHTTNNEVGINQLQNTQNGNIIFQASDEEQQQTSRGVSLYTNNQNTAIDLSYNNEKKGQGNKGLFQDYGTFSNTNNKSNLDQGSNNNDYYKKRYQPLTKNQNISQVRPKSMSINPVKSFIQPQSTQNPTYVPPPSNISKLNYFNKFHQNTQQQPSSLQPQISKYMLNSANYQQPKYDNRLVRFMHPQGTNILSIKPTRALSSDQYQPSNIGAPNRYPNYYRSPESRGRIERRAAAEQYGRVRQQHSPISKQQPSSIRIPSQMTGISYTSPSQIGQSPSNINSNTSKFTFDQQTSNNTQRIHSDKKLPICYGMRSPRNEKTSTPNLTPDITNPKINPHQEYFNSTRPNQTEYGILEKQVGEERDENTILRKCSNKPINSPKYGQNERKPNQRILVFSSSKRSKK